MTIDTLYDLVINCLSNGYAMWLGNRVYNPKKRLYWNLQLYNVQNCKEHYNLRWKEVNVKHSWDINIDIYSWLVYGKMYS